MRSRIAGLGRFSLLKITCSENSAPSPEGQSIAPNYSSVQIMGQTPLSDCVPEKVTEKKGLFDFMSVCRKTHTKKRCPNETLDLGEHSDGNKEERGQPQSGTGTQDSKSKPCLPVEIASWCYLVTGEQVEGIRAARQQGTSQLFQ